MIAQMMPGMQWIPLVAILVGLVVLLTISSLTFYGLRKFFPKIKFGTGTAVVIVLASLLMIRVFLPTPVSEARVIENAQPGMTVDDLVLKIGEPHEKYMSADGSGTLHYYGDYIGHTGIGVVVNSDGTIEDTWVE